MLQLLDRVYNRYGVRRILVNSLPKAGTHLLEKVVLLFPGISKAPLNMQRLKPGMVPAGSLPSGMGIPVGVDFDRGEMPAAALRRALGAVRRGQLASLHLPYSPGLAQLLQNLQMPMVLILRDPRDVVASWVRYTSRGQAQDNAVLRIPEAERLLFCIQGAPAGMLWPTEPRLRDIGTRCRSMLAWKQCPFVYTTYFERLVGQQGGGSLEMQLEEIERIGRHLQLRFRGEDLPRIARECFGGTSTFRKGSIGGWRDVFLAEHKEAFKRVAGDVLITMGYEQDQDW